MFILGAGAPISGSKPSALKNISSNTRAMDWQLHSFKNLTSLENIYYLGGYHVEEVINQYPELNFIVMPDWQSTSPLDTLLSAPLSGKA